jgi:hypothetical protein
LGGTADETVRRTDFGLASSQAGQTASMGAALLVFQSMCILLTT